jgi:ubiquinone/menaquinone biosynthesis C-methylase UbiE
MRFAKKYDLPLSNTGCDSVITQKQEQILFFKNNVSFYDKDVTDSMYFKTLDKLTFERWLDQNCKKISKPILELGCGTGQQSIQLAKRYKDAICLDISEEMILRVKYKIDHLDCPNKLNFIVGDAEDPPVKNNLFGACIMCSTLHHISSPEKAIVNLSDKLTNGGLFFSSDPHDSYVRFIFDFLMKVWKLHDEKASDDPLIREKCLKQWLTQAKIQSTVKFSTYLPPHIFLFLTEKSSFALLSRTDDLFNRIPGFYKFSGLVISEGMKVDNHIRG